MSQKSLYFWIVCQIKNLKHFRDMFICMDGWGSHLSYDTKKSENHLWLGWALATFVKDMKIRLRNNWLSILAEREVPQCRNCWWSDAFMINYDGYGFVPCMMCPTTCPHPTNPHPTPPYPTTCTITSPRTPSNTATITNTTTGKANNTLQSNCD